MRLKSRNVFVTVIIAASIAALSGCSGSQIAMKRAMKTEHDMDLPADGNISATAEAEKEKPDNNEAITEKEDAKDIGTLKPEAAEYFETTYGDFLKKGGSEAEALHGVRFIAECPDLDAEVVYEGVWDEDSDYPSIGDSS